LLAQVHITPERRHHESKANRHRNPVLPAARRPATPPVSACASGSHREASRRSPSPTATRVRALGSRSAATRTCRWPELANDARKTLAAGGTPLAPKVERAEAQKTKTYAEVVELKVRGHQRVQARRTRPIACTQTACSTARHLSAPSMSVLSGKRKTHVRLELFSF
jgi:hypothetical protein